MNSHTLLPLLGTLSMALAAQNLTIQPAVELEFPTTLNQAYQLQSSADMSTWQAFELIRLGDGKPARILVPAAESSKYFQLAANDVRNLNSLLEPIRAAKNVPALACAVVRSNRIIGMGAVGLRKSGVPAAPVTLNDHWHHGSLTKSMTATLAAMMVERGQIRWDTTLEEVFPSMAASMKPAWRTVRFDWLCSNRGGTPGDLNVSGISAQLSNFQGTPFDGRRLLLERLTQTTPTTTPGTAYEYSNAGFSLAGHMMETVSGRPWEDLLTEHLFLPLGMTSAGFGVPATPRHIDQPWGHQRVSGNNNPIQPGPGSDNPPAIGPSATVHCSLLDLARYAAFHVAGHRAASPLLSRAAMVKLHTAIPDNSGYAYGWIQLSRSWANGIALTHSGSNTQWYSVIWLAPNRDFAVVAMCNIASTSGANPGAQATSDAVTKMIQELL